MPFSDKVRLEAFVACQRHCCLCHERKHTRLVCHHIQQEADGGPNVFENCIPLCPDCHAEVKAFDPRHHPGMTSYSDEELIRRRDNWYQIVRRRTVELTARLHNRRENVPTSPELQGEMAFDYSNHDGHYIIGQGLAEFLTRWSRGSNRAIHAYVDGTNVAIATPPKNLGVSAIPDASLLDYSSRARTVSLGGLLVCENENGLYAAIKILALESSTHGTRDFARMSFWILDDGSSDFTTKA